MSPPWEGRGGGMLWDISKSSIPTFRFFSLNHHCVLNTPPTQVLWDFQNITSDPIYCIADVVFDMTRMRLRHLWEIRTLISSRNAKFSFHFRTESFCEANFHVTLLPCVHASASKGMSIFMPYVLCKCVCACRWSDLCSEWGISIRTLGSSPRLCDQLFNQGDC